MKFRVLTMLAVIMLGATAPTAHAYVYCITEVKEIYPHKDTGYVYFKFVDGTAVLANDSNEGRERNFAIALAALMAGRPVKVALNDGQVCGVNNYTEWTYLVAI